MKKLLLMTIVLLVSGAILAQEVRRQQLRNLYLPSMRALLFLWEILPAMILTTNRLGLPKLGLPLI